jgi:hypothetical protein
MFEVRGWRTAKSKEKGVSSKKDRLRLRLRWREELKMKEEHGRKADE